MKIPITIYLEESKKHSPEVEEFVVSSLKRWYNCGPIPLPHSVLVAKHGAEIVGTVALSFSQGNEIFSLEKIYKFDYNNMPLPFVRDNIVQFSRWVTGQQNVSQALLFTSALIGIKRGCEYGLGEVKPKIRDRFAEIGIDLYFIPADICPENIPLAIKPYYLIPPPPLPCMTDLRQEVECLKDLISSTIAEGNLIINFP